MTPGGKGKGATPMTPMTPKGKGKGLASLFSPNPVTPVAMQGAALLATPETAGKGARTPVPKGAGKGGTRTPVTAVQLQGLTEFA